MDAQNASAVVADTIALVRSSPRTITEICRDAGTSARWFYMVERGEIRSPQIHRIYQLRAAAQAAQDGAA